MLLSIPTSFFLLSLHPGAVVCFFFFSSRRRHTRCLSDWSSDVCSSDLFTGEGAWAVQKKIVQDEPPAPASINVALAPEFDRVVAKALAKDPNQRFATARQFAEALRRAAEGKPAVPEAEPTLVVPRDTPAPQATHPEALRSGEMELEFWRSIKDSDDANDFELYVRQFPQGVYASLAARKAAKLRSGSPVDDSGTRTMAGADKTRGQRSGPRAEAEHPAKHEAAESAPV